MKLTSGMIKALIYADLFAFPMTSNEIEKWLVKDNNITRKHYNNFFVKQKKGFCFLKNKENTVELRNKRQQWSKKKLEIAQRVGKWLKIVPWIKMVGITGSLAMSNSDQNDDIDLLIVASKNRIWLARLASTIIVELLGVRRHPLSCHSRESGNPGHSRKDWIPEASTELSRMSQVGDDSCFKDKICLNMFLDEDHLAVVSKERDLFTAHEVCQLKLLWDKEDTYLKFLKENEWVKNYLPNAVSQRPIPFRLKASERGGLAKTVAELILNKIEILAEKFQLWYMSRRRTTEIISSGVIRFHPQDLRQKILAAYQVRLESLSLQ